MPALTDTAHEGVVLGVDVGYSTLRPSLGYCAIEIAGGAMRILDGAIGLDSLEHFTSEKLASLIETYSPRIIAADGPMATSDARQESPLLNRPHERLLMRGALPPCIKAQPWLAPVGRQLTEATTAILNRAIACGYSYAPLTPGDGPAPENCVVESFPKIWLGMLLPPEWPCAQFAKNKVSRSHRDWWMAKKLLENRPRNRAKTSIMPIASLLEAGGLKLDGAGLAHAISQKDLAAATVSALSAAFTLVGWGGAIGSPRHGSFLVPASFLWAQGWSDVITRAADGFVADAAGDVIIRRRLA